MVYVKNEKYVEFDFSGFNFLGCIRFRVYYRIWGIAGNSMNVRE